MKRIINSIVKLLLILMATILPQMASAFSFMENGIAYNINSNGNSVTVTYTQLNSANNYSGLTTATIPSSVSYGGSTYSVTAIGDNAFAGCSGLTSVSIGSSVKTIGDNAFTGCTSLKSVTTGSAVTTIGNNAFEGCSAMTSATISNLVTTIGGEAFKGCSSLNTVTVGTAVDEIGKNAFYGCDALTKVKINSIPAWCNIDFNDYTSNPLYYAKNLYLGSSLKTELIIPNSVATIKKYAFYGCTCLASVTIGTAVTTIGEDAFTGCSGITTVNWNATNSADFSYETTPFKDLSNINSFSFGSTVTKIPAYICYYLSGLTSVTIPNSVTSIGDSAFSGCSGLTSVTIPNSVTSIGDGAFSGCSSLTSVTIPNSVTSIGYEAFYNCYRLTSVTIPNSVTEIGSSAFRYCRGLTSVTIPNSVTSIGYCAFYDCTGLTSVYITDLAAWCNIDFSYDANPLNYAHNLYLNGSMVTNLVIPNTVTIIKPYTFSGCSGLTSVTIPNSVTSIGYEAFYNCSGLTSVTIPNSVTSIGNYAFEDCSGLTKVNITDLAAWCNIDLGYDANPLSYAHNLYLNGSKVTNLVIPNTVIKIKPYTFSGCSSLTSVTIPNSVTSIGNYAFSGCSSLTSVTIPNSVTSIGNGAFYNCSGLTSVSIPNSVTKIGRDAFYGCSGLISVNINDLAAWCNIDFSYHYNDDYDYYNNRFYGNPLFYAQNLYLNGSNVTNLVIPNTVTEIKPLVFYGFHGLTSVTIPNSVISIGDFAFCGCSGLNSVIIGSSEPISNPMKSIGKYTFYNCSDLTTLTISNSVTSIGCQAFDSTSWYDNQPNGLVYAGMVAYKYKGNMPYGTSIVLEDGCTGIADNAFNNCEQLKSINIPNTVKTIGNAAFDDCSGLTSVTIPNSVTRIGDEAFDYCTSLSSVTIGSSVRTIGSYAFNYCRNLNEIYCCAPIPPGIADDDDGAFDNSIYAKCVLYIPRGSSLYYSLSYGWSAFVNVFEWDPALSGDANEDGTLNIGDYVTTASYILERNPQPFSFDAADVDGNGTVNVVDLVAIASMALNYQSSPSLAPAVGLSDASPAMTAEIAEKNAGCFEVAINLSNDNRLTAMQFDITLPQGLTLVDASLADRAISSHQVDFNKLGNGDYRMLVSSSASKAFTGNEGTVLRLTLAGTPSGNGSMSNIILASPEKAGYDIDDIELNFGSTEVEDVISAVKIYNDGNSIVIISPTSGSAQIVLPNGISQTAKVEAGQNAYPTAAKGLVIVRMDDKVVKLYR